MINSAEQDHFGLKPYREHGYIPGDKEHESIPKHWNTHITTGV